MDLVQGIFTVNHYGSPDGFSGGSPGSISCRIVGGISSENPYEIPCGTFKQICEGIS